MWVEMTPFNIVAETEKSGPSPWRVSNDGWIFSEEWVEMYKTCQNLEDALLLLPYLTGGSHLLAEIDG